MAHRSQARADDRLPRPPITNILPDTATIAAAGAVGRTVATLSTVGGTAGFIYTIANAGGMSIAIGGTGGNLILTTVNPVSTTGAKSVSVTSTDRRFQTKTETIAVTVT